MADRTESSIVIETIPATVIDAIADFELYPTWAQQVKEVEILSEEGDGWADQVRFTMDAGVIKDTYVLDYEWDIVQDGSGVVSWTLVEATIMNAMDGSYVVESVGPQCTKVTYRLSVDLKIPLVAALQRRAEQLIVDTALTELKKRVEA